MTRRLGATAISQRCTRGQAAHHEARSTQPKPTYRAVRRIPLALMASVCALGVATPVTAQVTVSEIVPPVAGCFPYGIAETNGAERPNQTGLGGAP